VTAKMCLVCGREFDLLMERCPKDGSVLLTLNKDPFIGAKITDSVRIDEFVEGDDYSATYKGTADGRSVQVLVFSPDHQLAPTSNDLQWIKHVGARILQLRHPNLVTILEFGLTKEPVRRFVISEPFQSTSLAAMLPIGVDSAVQIFAQVCDGLHYVHSHDLIHRSVTPRNIRVSDDAVKLHSTSFAKRLAPDDVLYYSVEGCLGKQLGPPSDIYMLAASLFHVITGQPLFEGVNSIQIVKKHLIEPPPRLREVNPRLEVSDEFEAFIAKSLAKNPDQRYATVLEFKEAMLAASKH
jgi:eukaryotic-like serine/threonine-protein kinase